jgi:hypothetical protein
MGKKNSKYAAELAKIKELRALDAILKKGDIENALLSNSAKDSEPISDNVIDAILNSADAGKTGERDLKIIERLTTNNPNKKRPSAKSKPKKAKAKVKRQKAKKPASKKKQKPKKSKSKRKTRK